MKQLMFGACIVILGGCAGGSADTDQDTDTDAETATESPTIAGLWQINALAFEDKRVREIPEEDGLIEGTMELRPTLSGTILIAYEDAGRQEREWTVTLTPEAGADDRYRATASGGYADMDMNCVHAGDLMDCIDRGESNWEAIDPYNWLRELQISR